MELGLIGNAGRRGFSLSGRFGKFTRDGVFVVVLLLIAGPVGFLLLGASLNDQPWAPDTGFTLSNWYEAYLTPPYLGAFLNTILLSTVSAFFAVLTGAAIAWLLARTNLPGRRRLAIFMVVPMMISPLVTTLAWIALAAPNAGFINAIIRAALSVAGPFDIYSLWGIVWVMALHYTSFAFITVYAALLSIDGSVEEACQMSGAGPIQTAIRITLPLVWPSLGTAFLLIFIFVSENFSVPAMLGSSSGFHTLSAVIYADMSDYPARTNQAAAAGTLLIWIALVGTFWQRQIAKQSRRYATIGGKGGRHRTADLGKWRTIAVVIVWLYLALAAILPYLALIFASLLNFVTAHLSVKLFTLDNYARMFSGEYLEALGNTLGLSVLGGLAATICYVALAYMIKRSRGPIGHVMDYAVVLPTVIPALVLGVGLVWLLAKLPLPIYGSIWALVVAYFLRYVGIGVRQSRSAFIQLGEELVEAVRMSGASGAQAFRYVLFPLLRPAIASLWTLLFIFIFMEISVTILLYSPHTKTLSVMLWSRMFQGQQTEAFAVAVLQATVILIGLLVTNRFFGTLRSALEGG